MFQWIVKYDISSKDKKEQNATSLSVIILPLNNSNHTNPKAIDDDDEEPERMKTTESNHLQQQQINIIVGHYSMGAMAMGTLVLGVVLVVLTVIAIAFHLKNRRRKHLQARTASTVFVFEANQC